MIQSAEQLILCTTCFEQKPAHEFRRRKRGTELRVRVCRSCHAAAERVRRRQVSDKRRRREMGKCLTALKNEQDGRRLEVLGRVMLSSFGGIEAFTAAWISYFNDAMVRGGPPALKCLSATARLMQYSAEKQATSFSEMSDEEVRRTILESTKQAIREMPELAVAAAAELGWELRPH